MLTPQEVEERVFPKAKKGGYDMQDVDNFLDQLTADYTELYKENAVLKRKMKVLADKITEYQETEGAMRATLLTAQKMAPASTRAPTAATARRRSRNTRTLPFLMAIPSFFRVCNSICRAREGYDRTLRNDHNPGGIFLQNCQISCCKKAEKGLTQILS